MNEALKAAIHGRLMGDYRTAGSTIDIHCSDGEVSLIGHADSDEQKTLAMMLVSGVIGVRAIKDEIVVRNQLESQVVPPGATPAA